MKFLKNQLHILIALLLIFIFWLFKSTSQNLCLNLYTSDFGVENNFIKIIFIRVLLSLFFLLLLYFLIKKNNLFRGKIFQVTYTILVIILIFNLPIFFYKKDHLNDKTVASICDKTTGDFMNVKSMNLTYMEYQFLQKRKVILPKLVSNADSIHIEYYHDGFLPDYNLNIRFRIPKKEKIELDGKIWREESSNENFRWISYTEYQE
jgi:hypothetical protein